MFRQATTFSLKARGHWSSLHVKTCARAISMETERHLPGLTIAGLPVDGLLVDGRVVIGKSDFTEQEDRAQDV